MNYSYKYNPIEDTFVFANITTKNGTFVSSGKISQKNLDVLRASGHIIEIIEEEEVDPLDIDGKTLSGDISTVAIPFNPHYTKNGVKTTISQSDAGRTIKIVIRESLGFREI